MHQYKQLSQTKEYRRNKTVSIRFIGLILLLLLLFIPTNGGGIPSYVLISILFLPYFLSRKHRLALKKDNWFIAYYAFTYIFSFLIHFYARSVVLAVSFLAYYIFVIFIVERSINTKHDFDSVISFTVIVFFIYSLLCINECLTGVNLFDIVFNRTYLWEGVGILRYGLNLSYGFLRIMHNNATLMCMMWAVAAYKLCNEKYHRFGWIICWVTIGMSCLMMMSRMVTFTAPILQLIIFRKRGVQWLNKRLFVIITIVLLFFLFTQSEIFSSLFNTIGGLLAPVIDELFGTNLKEQYNSTLGGTGQRLVLWNWIFNAVKDDLLLGKGFTDTWSTMIERRNSIGQIYYSEKTSIEVQWLYTLYKTGLFGLSGFIAFQFGTLKKIWKGNISSPENYVSFQYVMKWIAVFYCFYLFGIAAAEELSFFCFLFAVYVSYERICERLNSNGETKSF